MTDDSRFLPVATRTSSSILAGLKDPANEPVWAEYVARYRPLIVGYAVKVGLSPEDAEDVAQETLLAFSNAYREGRYERDKGRLRGWLFGIARRQLANLRRRHRPTPGVAAETGRTDFFARVEAVDELQRAWDQEWHQAVLRQCLEEVGREVAPSTLEAFRLFALQGRPAAEVARRLDLSENAVYGAKRRVLARIQEIHPRVDEVF